MSESRALPRRRPRAGQPPQLGLAEAAALGILVPGNTLGVVPVGDTDERCATFLGGRLEDIDPAAGKVVVAGMGLSGLAREEKVELACGVPGGLYRGVGKVADVDRAVLPPRVAIAVTGLSRVDERRAARVAVPGARATCRLPGRICDAPVADLSPSGIGLHAHLPEGSEVRVHLTVPGAEAIELHGRVTWADAASGRCGVTFAGVDEDARARITFICLFHRAFANERPAR